MRSVRPALADETQSDPRSGDTVSRAARQLEALILRGDVAPGDRLNELGLSRDLGVSRAVIREAVRGLEQKALVEIVPYRGVIVRRASIKDALDFYDLRAALFRAGAQLVARRGSAESIATLRAMNERMVAAARAGHFADYYAINLEFHAALMAASGNRPLAEAYATAVKRLHLFRRRSLLNPAQLNQSIREHEHILAAIEAGDVAAAGEAAERHIHDGRSRMLDTLDEEPPELRERTARATAPKQDRVRGRSGA
jgi:DNA-binding GntR family transcriptional regulator